MQRIDANDRRRDNERKPEHERQAVWPIEHKLKPQHLHRRQVDAQPLSVDQCDQRHARPAPPTSRIARDTTSLANGTSSAAAMMEGIPDWYWRASRRGVQRSRPAPHFACRNNPRSPQQLAQRPSAQHSQRERDTIRTRHRRPGTPVRILDPMRREEDLRPDQAKADEGKTDHQRAEKPLRPHPRDSSTDRGCSPGSPAAEDGSGAG